MCKIVEGEQESVETLIAAAAEGLEALREAAHGCPACMLAAIRQTTNDGLTDAYIGALQEFDFRKECEAAWSEYNHLAAN